MGRAGIKAQHGKLPVMVFPLSFFGSPSKVSLGLNGTVNEEEPGMRRREGGRVSLSKE